MDLKQIKLLFGKLEDKYENCALFHRTIEDDANFGCVSVWYVHDKDKASYNPGHLDKDFVDSEEVPAVPCGFFSLQFL